MKKIQLTITIICLAIALTALGTTLYAWFIPGTTFGNIEIYSSKLEAEVKIFSYADFNRDGILDVDGDGEYFGEYIYDLAEGIDGKWHIKNIKPDDYYFYRVEIKNTGDVDGLIKVTFTFSAELTTARVPYLFSHKAFSVLDEDALINRNVDRVSFEESRQLGFGEDILLEKSDDEGSGAPKQDHLVLYFSFKFETLDFIGEKFPTEFGGEEDLNVYQNMFLHGMTMVITLEQHVRT